MSIFRTHRSALLCTLLLAAFSNIEARPLLTEEVPTVGKRSFEFKFSMSERLDSFNTPETTYKTFVFPVTATLGLSRTVDLGVMFTYMTQRLEKESTHFNGSTNGRISPLLKVSPWDNVGFLFVYHTKNAEEGEQNLPMASGRDLEAIALFKLPTKWPISFNVGYLFRGKYKSRLGVLNNVTHNVEPGNIFEAKGALEIPLKAHFSVLGELAYYSSSETSISDTPVPDSAAKAMDGLVGLSWDFKGWSLATGAAFGLLDERYTSFNYERGAGDVRYQLSVSYKLSPKQRAQ